MRYLMLLVVLLVGCAGQGGGTAGDGTQETTSAPPPRTAEESITGTLGGNAALEDGCAWVDDGATRWEVQWPDGYEVTFDPLELHGPNGRVASTGDAVTVIGQESADVATACQIGPVWAATRVVVDQ